jgi:hypothetical protein
MAAKKSRKRATAKLAPRGDASGLARIRMWSNALETAMIRRYIGNATTLESIGDIVNRAVKQLSGIRPFATSDCPPGMVHVEDCQCIDPPPSA